MSTLPQSPNHLRVLVVEDEPISASLMRKHFEREGFHVDVAVDGIDALQKHSRYSYRVVVSDWVMPGMDGLALCREMRARSGSEVYFILCSGRSLADGRRQAFEAGVDDFLTKPINREELIPRMNAAKRILHTEDDLKTYSQELNEMSDSLAVAAKRFQGLFDGLPVACFTIDQEDNIRDWNNSAESVFGYSAEQAIGHHAADLLVTDISNPWPAERVRHLLETGSLGTFDWEFVRDCRNSMLTSNLITMSENGKVKGAICASIDVTERRRTEKQLTDYAQSLANQAVELEAANRKLSHLAITDGLTGLWNHRRFHEVLNSRLMEFEKIKFPFSLILLDIDHFKMVNDRLGHQEGDQVLRHFAQTLKENSREAEAPFRYGGEEFAILLRNCDEQKSVEAAKRFCDLIRGLKWSHWPMTASLGVTTSSPGSTAKSLIAEADRALYTAKRAGRNRIVHWNAIEQDDHSDVFISA